jgi:hypothetical protein
VNLMDIEQHTQQRQDTSVLPSWRKSNELSIHWQTTVSTGTYLFQGAGGIVAVLLRVAVKAAAVGAQPQEQVRVLPRAEKSLRYPTSANS